MLDIRNEEVVRRLPQEQQSEIDRNLALIQEGSEHLELHEWHVRTYRYESRVKSRLAEVPLIVNDLVWQDLTIANEYHFPDTTPSNAYERARRAYEVSEGFAQALDRDAEKICKPILGFFGLHEVISPPDGATLQRDQQIIREALGEYSTRFLKPVFDRYQRKARLDARRR